MEKPIIEYPCDWSYRIIGTDEQLLRKAALDCLGNIDYSISVSNYSSSGKYISLNIETVVSSESARNRIHASLGRHSCVKMVL
jgi:putative lipoic acid-binding regulatory protein